MRKSALALAVAALAALPAQAAIDTYVATLLGANEVPAADPDGFGVAAVTIDNVALTVSWSILALQIDLPLTGAHIHAGAAGVNGGVVVNFAGQLTGTGLFDADLAGITPGSAANYYVNLHNAAYPGGAIRGQLQYVTTVNPPIPEPGTYAMLLAGLGAVVMVASRRRREDAAA
jgi:hypothetical protein